MGEHAKLSPSDAERWISCPAAIGMDALFPPEEESVYAREGTCAHALGEIKASFVFGFTSFEEKDAALDAWRAEFEDILTHDDFEFDEMDRHTDAYVELIAERLAVHPDSSLRLEQRMDAGVPECWGTSDAVIVSPIHVEAIDFKYGKGVQVNAVRNPQLRLYACGALDTFGDVLGETETVTMTVHQPRLNHILSETLTADELRAWRAEVAIPRALLALSDDAPFGPSEAACRWCPASGQCQAQLEAVFATDFEEDPKVLTPEDMAEIQPKIKMIRDWLNAFEEAALDMAYSQGKPIPGYKVVLSGGQRSIPDKEATIKFLVEEKGYSEDDITVRKIRGLGELEKLMGVEEFAEICKDYIKPPQGKPALVHESDKRPAINPDGEAAKAFEKENLL